MGMSIQAGLGNKTRARLRCDSKSWGEHGVCPAAARVLGDVAALARAQEEAGDEPDVGWSREQRKEGQVWSGAEGAERKGGVRGSAGRGEGLEVGLEVWKEAVGTPQQTANSLRAPRGHPPVSWTPAAVRSERVF